MRKVYLVAVTDSYDSEPGLEFNDPCPESGDLEQYLNEALHRFRIGYRKAKKRFPVAWKAHEQFRAIRDACKPTHLDMYEGAEFVLIWGGERAICDQIYPED